MHRLVAVMNQDRRGEGRQRAIVESKMANVALGKRFAQKFDMMEKAANPPTQICENQMSGLTRTQCVQ